jgi:sterol desaturase/sphingolipid hydroxylase (fatty acid hydroxylase superfamily)
MPYQTDKNIELELMQGNHYARPRGCRDARTRHQAGGVCHRSHSAGWRRGAGPPACTIGSPSNLTLVTLNTLVTRALLPLTAVGMAVIAEQRGWGLLHAVGPIPAVLAVPAAIVLLDFAIYLQHVLFHVVPLLWRVHRVHHADIDVDVTTGSRFHPVEILVSMLIKFAAISALGPLPIAVLLFEMLLNVGSLFNHANLRLLPWLDRALRVVVVTPDMHRVHHSASELETNTNFGFTFPWWDHLCGTYRAQPAAGHEAMTVGLTCFRDPKYLRLDRTLLQPLSDGSGGQESSSDRPHNQRVMRSLTQRDGR